VEDGKKPPIGWFFVAETSKLATLRPRELIAQHLIFIADLTNKCKQSTLKRPHVLGAGAVFLRLPSHKKNAIMRYMFQNDAVTFVTEISGATTNIFTDQGDYTVLMVSMQQANNSSATTIKCGNDLIAKNYATNFSAVPMNYQCTDDILQVQKTGNDSSTVIVTYVPYLTNNYSTTTQFGYNPDGDISTTSDVQVYGAISAGELIIASILLMGIVFFAMSTIARALSGIKLNRKFIKYQGGDVPIDHD